MVAALAAIVVLHPGAAAASPGMQRAGDQTGARAYWTPARMRAAEPVDAVEVTSLGSGAPTSAGGTAAPSFVGPAEAGAPAAATLRSGSITDTRRFHTAYTREEVADPAAPSVSAHGKVFFTVTRGTEPGDYVCSGTAVNSRNRSVVWTAGHCVYDNEAGGGYSKNFIFVPGYKDGAEPYGEWRAKKIGTTAGWRYDANIRFDLGAAVVSRDSSGRKLQNVVGARGIGFSQPRIQNLDIFGYPADPIGPPPHLEFQGEREFHCLTRPFGTDHPGGGSGPPTTGVSCDMSAGSSGGGWINPSGVLLSVTSYGYPDEIDHLYGPYMTKQAKALYKAARGKRRR
jgi:hypothetical protein